MTNSTTNLDGWCAPGFVGVRDALATQMEQPKELGAAVHVVVDGDVVVDLWGGWADRLRTRRWRRATLADAYSVGKPILATLLLQLVDDGAVDLDHPVAKYWPEFAAHGKGGVTVRQALCHRAGVPAITERLTNDDLWDFDRMCAAVAASEPWWVPSDTQTRHAYHTNSYGHLIGGLVRQVTGELPGTRLRRLAELLDADVHFGVRDEDQDRCAEIFFDRPDLVVVDDDGNDELGIDPYAEALGPEARMNLIGSFNPPGYSSVGVVNTPEWRRAQVPSTNGQMTARGIARIYNGLMHGKVLSLSLLHEATRAQSAGYCPILGQDVTFGLGFQPWTPNRPFGRNPGGFGHFGTGGSLGFADPSQRLALGYVTNHVVPRWQNPYNRAIVDAVYESLG